MLESEQYECEQYKIEQCVNERYADEQFERGGFWMPQEEELGFQIHALSRMIRRQTDKLAFQNDDMENPIVPGNAQHGWIIGYLYRHRDRDIYQRDVQEAFRIRRSTVTGILQQMEKNGMVTRSSVESDARLKKITLTPKAIALHESIISGIQKTEEMISKGLTPAEKKAFLLTCQKIRKNLEAEDPTLNRKRGSCDD